MTMTKYSCVSLHNLYLFNDLDIHGPSKKPFRNDLWQMHALVPETNIADISPENGWLEYDIVSFLGSNAYFQWQTCC